MFCSASSARPSVPLLLPRPTVVRRDAPVRQSVIKSGEGEEAERGGRSWVGVGSDFAAAAVGADGDDGEGGAGNDCHSKK